MSAIYELAGLKWGSKAAALDHLYRIRERYRNGVRVEGMDAMMLVAATDLHAGADQKRGCGISHFTVERAGKDRCFWLHRTDGTSTDISFRYIFDDPAKRERDDRLKALRQAVDKEIAPLRKRGMHVHHVIPFATLVDDWLASLGMTLEQIEVIPTADGEMRCEMADESLKHDWWLYHDRYARYEIMTAAAHRAFKHEKKGGKP
jgi:hypothetical protein